MTAPEDRWSALVRDVSDFNRERAWRRFHAPKNLAMALAIEAAELMEPFRWTSARASWALARGEANETVRRELADVVLVAISMSDYLGLDLIDLVREKLEENRKKYPADQSRGRSDKYTAYQK